MYFLLKEPSRISSSSHSFAAFINRYVKAQLIKHNGGNRRPAKKVESAPAKYLLFSESPLTLPSELFFIGSCFYFLLCFTWEVTL